MSHPLQQSTFGRVAVIGIAMQSYVVCVLLFLEPCFAAKPGIPELSFRLDSPAGNA